MCFFPCETISSLIVKGSSDYDGDLCVKRISLKLVFTLKLLCVCLGHCDLKDYHFDYLVSGLLVSLGHCDLIYIYISHKQDFR